MLQAKEIEQRFNRIEQAIGQASKVLRTNQSASPELKKCIEQLDQQSGKAKQAVQSHDEARIIQSIDDLEMLGDQAKRALLRDTKIPADLKQVVTQVHDELSDLKHQLH